MDLSDDDLGWRTYEIKLNNKELISVAELSFKRLNVDYVSLLRTDLFSFIPRINREHVDSAIRGYDKDLKNKLGNPGKIRLLKSKNQPCKHKKSCSTYDSMECRPDFFNRGVSSFPLCYVHPSDDASISHIMTEIMLMWKDDRIVIIVDE